MTGLQKETGSGLELAVRVPLSQDKHAPAEAREAIRTTLASWRLPELVDAVMLVASELVTNAIRYGRPPVEMTIRRLERKLRVDIHDEEPSEPDLTGRERVSPSAESGRGIEIVQSVADDVGLEQIPDDGKVLYAEFVVDTPTPL